MARLSILNLSFFLHFCCLSTTTIVLSYSIARTQPHMPWSQCPPPDWHGWQYFMSAASKYPIGNGLVRRIRALGSPTKSTPPPAAINRALEIMGAITANILGIRHDTGVAEAEALIISHWTSTFEPWVKVLFQVILAKEVPSDVSGIDRLEKALICLPGFLMFRDTGPDSSTLTDANTFMTVIGRKSPEIPRLVVEVWTKVLGDHHSSGWYWTVVMQNIVRSLTKNTQINCTSERYGIPVPGIHEGNHQMGLTLVSHLIYQAQRMSEITLEEIRTFTVAFTLMNDASFKHESPLYFESVRKYSLPAVIKLFSSVTRRQPKEGEFASFIYDISHKCLNYLFGLMNDYHWVSEALEHGIMKSIFNVHPSFFQRDLEFGTAHPAALSNRLAGILQRVSSFLIYRSVLQPFTRVSRKISRSGKSEKRMKENCEVIYNAWMQATESASTIRSVRRVGMKHHGIRLNLCSSAQCPRKYLEAIDETALDVKYSSCAACSSVMYCSVTCQTFDWKDGHRERCATIVNFRSLPGSDRAMITEFDRKFLEFWVMNYIDSNLPSIQYSVAQHLAQLKRTSHSQSDSQSNSSAEICPITPDQQAILDRIRNPALYLEFLGPESFPVLDRCLVIMDSTRKMMEFGQESFEMDASRSEFVSRWRASGTTDVMVLASFPVKTSYVATISLHIPFGDLGPEDGEGDEYKQDQYDLFGDDILD